MMKLKKTFAGLLTVTILSTSAVTAFANIEDLTRMNGVAPIKDMIPISSELNEGEQAYFGSFAGKVKEIANFEAVEGSKIILLEDQAGNIANIIVSKDTYILNNAEIAVGSEITGYYDAKAPMIMIYPAQYNAEVVVVRNGEQNVKVDHFNKDLISSDNWLKLNILDATKILMEDGTAFEGQLTNRKLVIVYGVATKSIPAQTTPSKIVVLFEKADPVIGDVSTMDIVVNNKKIEAIAAYMNEKGAVMVPLRAIAETLGFDVIWNNEEQSVMLGKNISLKIGEDHYIYMKTAPIQLGNAPEIKEGKTYVPLNFFREVTRMNNAYVFESQIVIDNEEAIK
ncbi:MAG: copper amine oxidase family protein [Clostridia bacterium]|nr:copper amine oxidase family protein [Clostridia bacterium]